MKLEENISRIVMFIVGSLMMVTGFVYHNVEEAELFFGILSFIGLILIIISLILNSVSINHSDDEVTIQFDKTWKKYHLLRAFYVVTAILFCVIQSCTVNQIQIGGITVHGLGLLNTIGLLIITTIYLKLIGRSAWYGLLGLLSIYSIFFIIQFTPKQKFIDKVNP